MTGRTVSQLPGAADRPGRKLLTQLRKDETKFRKEGRKEGRTKGTKTGGIILITVTQAPSVHTIIRFF